MRTSFSVSLRCAISVFCLTALADAAPAQENVWTSHGPMDIGYVNDVAIADSVAYAATPNGVFRSSDSGTTWQQSGLAGESINQIDARPGAAVVLAKSASGILYASGDGGETWARIPGLPSVFVAAIDPWHLSTIYAGASDGTIWKSTDGGASVQRLSTTPAGYGAQALEFDSRAIYIISFDDLDNLYKLYQSLDGGVSWATVSSPIPLGTIAAGAAPGLVYAGGLNNFCRSEDSAATWTCSNFPQYPVRIVEVPGGSPGAAPRILASSLDGVYVSSDKGATWARTGELGPVGYFPTLASDASGSLVLAGTETQIFRSQDRGDSWTAASAGLQSSSIQALALDPQDPSTVWAAAFGFAGSSNLFRSADGGFSWSPAGGPEGALSGDTLVIDPEHSSTLYAGGRSAVYRSYDSGAHWTSSTLPGGASVTDLAVDPDSPERVWAASYAGLFRSDDGAQSWTSPASVAQEIYCILFDRKRPDTLYAGSFFDWEPGYYSYPFGGSIFVSRDSGSNWTKSSHDFGSPVLAIATDPFRDGVLYAGTATGVFRSADDGRTWEESAQESTDIGRVLSLVADPLRPGHLYTTTDFGVYRTIDGARTWHPFSSGLGSLQAQPLVISPDGKWLHAGTNGGGVFELDLENSYPCSPTATRLCLVGNRYAVELAASRRGESRYSPGAARPLSDRAGYFALPFATGDPDLPEVVVKMLPEGTFGAGGAPLFYSSLTTLPYVLTVTDTVTGLQEIYAGDPEAPLCGTTDHPFGALEASMSLRAAPAAAGETTLRLLGGRFSVTLDARNPHTGLTATGLAISQSDRFGYFSLPELTGDSQFPEVVVKMIDFRAVSGKFWFFYTGLTGLDYTLTLTDSVTGAVRTYESPGPFCGGADTAIPSTQAVEP